VPRSLEDRGVDQIRTATDTPADSRAVTTVTRTAIRPARWGSEALLIEMNRVAVVPRPKLAKTDRVVHVVNTTPS